MKKYGLLLAFVVLAFSVPLAQSSTTGTPQRLARLEKQVRNLQTQLTAVKLRVACFRNATRVTSYGVPSSNEGYLYQRPSATPSTFPTTALDFTLQGDKPDAFLATVNARCVTGTTSAASASSRGARHRVPLVPLRSAR